MGNEENKREERLDRSIKVRLDTPTWEILEELRGLGINPSEFVRGLLEDMKPTMQGMIRTIRAVKEGRPLDTKKELRKVLAEIVREFSKD